MSAIYKNSVQYSGSQVAQADWNQASSSAPDYIKNKPTALSDFANDQGFITYTTEALTNYYKKSETYTQTEINALISAIPTFEIEVVESLLVVTDPNEHTVYLVPSGSETGNLYTEYIYIIDSSTAVGSFEKLGTQTLNLAYSNAYLPGVTNVQDGLDALVDIDKKDFWLTSSKGTSATSVTFTDSRITTTSIYEIYTDDPSLMYTTTTLSTGSIVVNFDSSYSHVSAINIKVYVHNP